METPEYVAEPMCVDTQQAAQPIPTPDQSIKVQVEDQILEVSLSIAKQFGTLASMIEDVGDEMGTIIPIPSVTAAGFQTVLGFVNEQKRLLAERDLPIITSPPYPGEKPAAAAIAAEYEIVTTKAQRTKDQAVKMKTYCIDIGKKNMDDLMILIKTLDFLNNKALLKIACQSMAEMLTNKTPDEIKELFGITYNFTPEEEEEIIDRNPWCTDMENDAFLKKLKHM